MASKRSRKRARQARARAAGGRITTKRERREGRRGGRSGRPEVSRAVASGVIGSAARAAIAIARSPLGRKALTVARQQIVRLPGVGRFASRTRAGMGAGRPTGLVSRTGRELAVQAPKSVARRVAVTGGKIAAGGLAFEAGSTLFAQFAPGGSEVARALGGRRGGARRTRGQAIPFTPGGIVPTDSITHTWVANGVPFAQLADGRVMVRRKNGTIKTFRRPRPIVLGRNPGIRDLVRADKKIDGLMKLVRKRMPTARRRPAQHSVTHP